jgi:hypothetical protein
MSEDTRAKKGTKRNPQPYDTAIKALFHKDGASMVPFLFPGAVVGKPLNVEHIPPPMRVDSAFRMRYRSRTHVMHFEYQVSADGDMIYRALIYCAMLFREHKMPVICAILYLFPCTLPETSISMRSGEQEILHFEIWIFALWKFDARAIVQEQHQNWYPLLPAMGHVDARLLLHALNQMVQWYTDARLRDYLLCFKIFLTRSETISREDKELVMQQLEQTDVFKQLLFEDPDVKAHVDRQVKVRTKKARKHKSRKR